MVVRQHGDLLDRTAQRAHLRLHAFEAGLQVHKEIRQKEAAGSPPSSGAKEVGTGAGVVRREERSSENEKVKIGSSHG